MPHLTKRPTVKDKKKEEEEAVVVVADPSQEAPAPPQEEPMTPPVLVDDPHMRMLAFSRDLTLSRISLVLQAGSRASTTTMSSHSGLYIALCNTYTMGAADTFVTILQTYLLEAAKHLPHCPLPEQILDVIIPHLKEVIEQYGFLHVARYLLRGISY